MKKVVSITPQELSVAADRIKPIKETAGDIVMEIQELYESLGSSGAWKGAAYDKIVSVTKNNSAKFSCIEENLGAMEQFLRSVAEKCNKRTHRF